MKQQRIILTPHLNSEICEDIEVFYKRKRFKCIVERMDLLLIDDNDERSAEAKELVDRCMLSGGVKITDLNIKGL